MYQTGRYKLVDLRACSYSLNFMIEINAQREKRSKARSLAARVRLSRQNAKLSCKQLSLAIGACGPYVSSVESGRIARPGADMLIAIANRCQVNYPWLITGQGRRSV